MPNGGKSGSRRKTGCFACRARHLRCDETLPRCTRCVKANLECTRNPVISFVPAQTLDCKPESAIDGKCLEEATPDPGDAQCLHECYLLRRFQDIIAPWMDIFDHGSSFQLHLLRRAACSQLLRSAICALASRQLAFTTMLQTRTEAADRHYGASLRLLMDSLAASQASERGADKHHQGSDGELAQDVHITLPASVLLLSFELMAGTGHSYTQHFEGAKSLIETHFDIIIRSKDPLLRASYWVFVRNDVHIALARERPIRLSEKYLIKQATHTEDNLGNASLILAAKMTGLVYDSSVVRTTVKDLELEVDAWREAARQALTPLQVDIDGAKRPWYPTPSGASAMQMYLVTKLLLSAKNGARHVVQGCAEEILAISQSYVSDAVQIQASWLLYHAAKHGCGKDLRKGVLQCLHDTMSRTGFHTQDQIDNLTAG